HRPGIDHGSGAASGHEEVHAMLNQITSQGWQAIDLSLRKAGFDNDILPLDIALLLQPLPECGDDACGISGASLAQIPDHRHCPLLRAQPPHHSHRSGKDHQKLAAVHSITSSARARIEGGTVRPSSFAVLRLTTSSNVVGCWTGRSAGFEPL